MYSVVLATMLTAGGTTPAFCHHWHGCYGGCYGCYSCGCYGGCYGWRGGYCSGCYGGYGRYGCYGGGCYGGGYYGGYGYGGYGCGCYGCYGGGCYGCYSSCSVYYGCTGCSVCCGGVIVGSTAPTVIELPKSGVAPKSGGVVQQQPAMAANPAPNTKTARVTVIVPAEARLWVDNVECPLSSTTRSFNTPPLNPNQQYFYNLKVEVARDGRNITETQRVLITPGQEARVDFNNVGALATASR